MKVPPKAWDAVFLVGAFLAMLLGGLSWYFGASWKGRQLQQYEASADSQTQATFSQLPKEIAHAQEMLKKVQLYARVNSAEQALSVHSMNWIEEELQGPSNATSDPQVEERTYELTAIIRSQNTPPLVILNNQRMRVGQSLKTGEKLVAIQSQGAILLTGNGEKIEVKLNSPEWLQKK